MQSASSARIGRSRNKGRKCMMSPFDAARVSQPFLRGTETNKTLPTGENLPGRRAHKLNESGIRKRSGCRRVQPLGRNDSSLRLAGFTTGEEVRSRKRSARGSIFSLEWPVCGEAWSGGKAHDPPKPARSRSKIPVNLSAPEHCGAPHASEEQTPCQKR